MRAIYTPQETKEPKKEKKNKEKSYKYIEKAENKNKLSVRPKNCMINCNLCIV